MTDRKTRVLLAKQLEESRKIRGSLTPRDASSDEHSATSLAAIVRAEQAIYGHKGEYIELRVVTLRALLHLTAQKAIAGEPRGEADSNHHQTLPLTSNKQGLSQ